jgi:hypothetical protein
MGSTDSAAAGDAAATETDKYIGLALALSSSAFIGASFIVKKKGLRRAASATGISAGGWVFVAVFAPEASEWCRGEKCLSLCARRLQRSHAGFVPWRDHDFLFSQACESNVELFERLRGWTASAIPPCPRSYRSLPHVFLFVPCCLCVFRCSTWSFIGVA